MIRSKLIASVLILTAGCSFFVPSKHGVELAIESPSYLPTWNVVTNAGVMESWPIIEALKSWNKLIGYDIFLWYDNGSERSGTLIINTVCKPSADWHGVQLDNNDGPSIILNACPDLKDKYQIKIVMHELGHVLGIQHNSDPNSIMYEELLPIDQSVLDSDMKQILWLTSQ